MIEAISIRNIALIEELDLELSPGLNIFTGETGAGKSVILKSIGLVLGERTSPDIVREGAKSASVEIGVVPSTPLPSMMDMNDTFVLARQISSNGRSRCRINGELANLKKLEELGTLLVDIHGQHEHQSLFRTETHLELLDDFGETEKEREQVSKHYHHLLDLKKELDSLLHTLRSSEREKELLEFEVKELTSANLQEGEEEELTAEISILNNAEELYESANLVYEQLDGEVRSEFDASSSGGSASVLESLRDSAKTVAKLTEVDTGLLELSERIASSLYELEDIAMQIRHYAEAVEFNPTRLTEVTDRLELISKFKRRYGSTISEMIEYHADAERKLSDLELGSEKTEELQSQIRELKLTLCELCIALSVKRKKVAERLSALVEKELQELGMEKAEFYTVVQPIEDDSGLLSIDGKQYALRENGMDKVEFLIAPNVGSELRPLARIASGGEISRVMLALKTVLVKVDNIPTVLFDEIDSGIGGKIADVVGKKLKELSQSAQVICITHLPQIARFADRHFLVEKDVVGERTLITAKSLTDAERVTEIARMHGGKETEVGLAHARELLNG
ncbi:MAG: DNA repair protein RecN [Candidatus Poribacteria bacterium]|nr:DNA repair protein RecN [Candidatus Poribacteria bacterium]